MPMYEAKAPLSLSPMRLDKFINTALPQLPQKAVREAFCRRDVKMNGKRCPKETVVEPGAVIQVFTPWKGEELDVIYEDNQILLINKRAGISVTADESGAQGVLERQRIRHRRKHHKRRCSGNDLQNYCGRTEGCRKLR